MSRFAHHAFRRAAEAESGFAHARYIVVPALLWAAALMVALVAAANQNGSGDEQVQSESPEEVAVVPLGA